jgi:hypothetical protein
MKLYNGNIKIAAGLLGHELSLERAALRSQAVVASRDAILVTSLHREELLQLAMKLQDRLARLPRDDRSGSD